MDNVILPEQRIDGFGYGLGYNVPATGFNFGEGMDAFSLLVGETYTVRWNGTVCTVIALDMSAVLPGAVGIGNPAVVGGPNTEEPFAIACTPNGAQFFALDGGEETYRTVGIWLGEVQPEEPDAENDANDAVILNYSQNPVRYENVPKVWLTHPDSTEEDVKLVPFTFGEAVSKSVNVDFSTGDMAVDIPAGELVTELTVKKPEDLKPENIPEGMYIAGVGPGEFKGGAETVETTVALDFSDGDMVVTPEDGQSFSAVTIPKPENLSPENIAEGVEIAGVMGALAGGGMEVGTFGNLKYIIPIKEYIGKGTYSLYFFPMTYRRSTTEQIRVLLWPDLSYKPTSTGHKVVFSITHGCTFIKGRSYTYPYAHAVAVTLSSYYYYDMSFTASSGNLTEVSIPKKVFAGDIASNVMYQSGWYYGVILVTDSAHSGPATILKENNYIESTYIQVIT